MRSEQSWSLLDPRPLTLYLQRHDEYIVYWRGVVMPHSMALCMAMEFVGIYPTPEMKTAMETTYRKLYYADAFNTRAWDLKVAESPIYPYLKRIMAEHFKGLMEDADPSIVLGWFDYNRARIEE